MHRAAFASVLVLLFTPALFAADRTVAGQFITEPPTLISLGFEWEIDGDDNRNAAVAVSYRKKGEPVWKQGLPLLRLQQRADQPGAAPIHHAEHVCREHLRSRARTPTTRAASS